MACGDLDALDRIEEGFLQIEFVPVIEQIQLRNQETAAEVIWWSDGNGSKIKD